jgi:hypothetical protein
VEWKQDSYVITTDSARVDIDVVYDFLNKESYWARGVPLDVIKRSITGSMCFSMFRGDEQVGFARVVSDRATVAYLGDVFVCAALCSSLQMHMAFTKNTVSHR